jgi:hypothetical protein
MKKTNWIEKGSFKAPSAYASYYVNGDATGLTDSEVVDADRLLNDATKGLKWASVVDCLESPDYVDEFKGISLYPYIFESVTESNGVYRYTGKPLESMEFLLGWQKQGLCFSASGYGSKIATTKKVFFENRWHRVYAMVYGNSGTCYFVAHGQDVIISDCDLL